MCYNIFCTLPLPAAVVELVDTRDSKFRVLTDVPVRFRLAVPKYERLQIRRRFYIIAVEADSRGLSGFQSQ